MRDNILTLSYLSRHGEEKRSYWLPYLTGGALFVAGLVYGARGINSIYNPDSSKIATEGASGQLEEKVLDESQEGERTGHFINSFLCLFNSALIVAIGRLANQRRVPMRRPSRALQ